MSCQALARGYTIDLAAPKVVYCSDGLVEALIRSGAHKYLEFKALEGTWMWWQGAMHVVPASRSEVFRQAPPQKYCRSA